VPRTNLPFFMAAPRWVMGTRPGNLEDRSVLTKVNADPGSLEIVRKQAPYPQERLLLSSLLSLLFAVAITPKSTQHTGLTQSVEGSVAAWLVKFQLDGDNSINAAVSIPLAGPRTHRDEKAFKILQVFLNDAAEAATKFRFSD
jgi:hypothetical protein